MKVAIMQPYFMPYIGYFQLMKQVDKFVIYDNIEFTKKGWIHRNRMLVNGADAMFSLSIKKDSDYLHVRQRFLADNHNEIKEKILRKIANDYRKAPYFGRVFPLIEKIFNYSDTNLFEFIYFSIEELVEYLEIDVELLVSSSIEIDQKLTSQEKVIAICKSLKATEYYNTSGGKELYDKSEFLKNELKLCFMKSLPVSYKQFDSNDFVSFLSIMDVLMFNSLEEINLMLDEYELF